MHIVNIMWTVRDQGVIMCVREQIVMVCVILVWCFDDCVVSRYLWPGMRQGN